MLYDTSELRRGRRLTLCAWKASRWSGYPVLSRHKRLGLDSVMSLHSQAYPGTHLCSVHQCKANPRQRISWAWYTLAVMVIWEFGHVIGVSHDHINGKISIT